MIVNRYIMRHVYTGTLFTVVVLTSIAVFFILVGELKYIGRGNYGMILAIQHAALLVPGKVVEFMPLAILLGTILNLGLLASNSEIIALQAAGISVYQLLRAVLQAAIVLALVNFIVAEWVVPLSEAGARDVKSAAINESSALRSKNGVWVKDINRILYIKVLLPDAVAQTIEIYELDDQGRLVSTTTADSAIPRGNEWVMQQVKITFIGNRAGETIEFEEKVYDGNISFQLLDTLMIEPDQMSSVKLFGYIKFLQDNNLDDRSEKLIFWQKVLAPFAVIIMCFLAVPFVMGSQRQSNSGQRLMFGILLGLAYIVADRLLILLGSQVGIHPLLNAVSPALLFLMLAIYLLVRKQSLSSGD